jgi:hypothetical protein
MHPGNPYARPPAQQHDAYYGQPRHPGDNVSAPVPVASGVEHSFASARGGSRPQPAHVPHLTTNDIPDGISEADPSEADYSEPREKSVQFDLTPRGPSREPSPDKAETADARDNSDDHDHDHHRRHRRRKDDDRSDSTRESGRHRKRHHRDHSPASDSDTTIDLPPRFDERGRRKPEDPMADKLESVLQSLFR